MGQRNVYTSSLTLLTLAVTCGEALSECDGEGKVDRDDLGGDDVLVELDDMATCSLPINTTTASRRLRLTPPS